MDIGTYLDIINPYKFKETIAREAKKDDAKVTAINIVIIAFIATLANFINYRLKATKTGFFGLPHTHTNNLLNLSSPISIFITFIWFIIYTYLSYIIIQSIAKAFGGNGKINNLRYLLSTLAVPGRLTLTFLITLLFLNSNVWLFCCGGLIFLLIPIVYVLYLDYVALRAVHSSLSRNRAILTVFLALVIEGIILLAVNFIRIRIGI